MKTKWYARIKGDGDPWEERMTTQPSLGEFDIYVAREVYTAHDVAADFVKCHHENNPANYTGDDGKVVATVEVTAVPFYEAPDKPRWTFDVCIYWEPDFSASEVNG